MKGKERAHDVRGSTIGYTCFDHSIKDMLIKLVTKEMLIYFALDLFFLLGEFRKGGGSKSAWQFCVTIFNQGA
jgi:hypothetical protein